MRRLRDRRMRQAHPYHPPAATGLARPLKLGSIPSRGGKRVENLRVDTECLYPGPRTCCYLIGSKAWLRDVGDRRVHRQI